MKKSLIFLASAMLVIGGLTSCQKQYTCVCTYEDGGVEKENISETVKTTRAKAEEICNRTTTIDGVPATCSLRD